LWASIRTIQVKNGWLSWDDNKILSGEFTKDMTTIKNDDSSARLEGHLKSDDFFCADKFTESRLEITGSEPFNKSIMSATDPEHSLITLATKPFMMNLKSRSACLLIESLILIGELR